MPRSRERGKRHYLNLQMPLYDRPVIEYYSPDESGERWSWRRALAVMASLILVMVGVVLMLVGAVSCWEAEALGPAAPPERLKGWIACGVVAAIGLVVVIGAGRCLYVAFPLRKARRTASRRRAWCHWAWIRRQNDGRAEDLVGANSPARLFNLQFVCIMEGFPRTRPTGLAFAATKRMVEMGPTNVALVKLFRADAALREAQARLDAAARNVRIQERRVNDLGEKLKLGQAGLREQQAKAGQLDLDLKSRDAHIEKLRTQQQTAKNNKEYQAFLVEINTAKVDRNKVEDEAMKVLEAVEKEQNEVGAMQTQLQAEQQKLQTLKQESGDTVARLQAEVEALRPDREQAYADVPPKGRDAFDRLADRFEGEAMSAVAKPDRRREEYLCSACNMSLVVDVYNKLHSRDELVFCPSCHRILYIPEDLPPETAIHSSKAASGGARRAKATAEQKAAAEPRAKGKWGRLLAAAQGESVKAAMDAQNDPLTFQVKVNGELAGVYKGKSRENLERVIQFRMQELGMTGQVEVIESAEQTAAAEADQSAATP